MLKNSRNLRFQKHNHTFNKFSLNLNIFSNNFELPSSRAARFCPESHFSIYFVPESHLVFWENLFSGKKKRFFFRKKNIFKKDFFFRKKKISTSSIVGVSRMRIFFRSQISGPPCSRARHLRKKKIRHSAHTDYTTGSPNLNGYQTNSRNLKIVGPPPI